MAGRLLGVQDVAPGLWIWRIYHPFWHPGDDWEPVVTTTVVESEGEVALLDPLAPDDDARDVWKRLDEKPPTMVVILKPDHVRDVDVFVRRYGIPAYGPGLFWKNDLPDSELEMITPGMELPGNMLVLSDGRWGQETPLYIPGVETIVFADAMTERRGRLRVWSTPWNEEPPLRELDALKKLPFSRVVISHGSPVHDRAAYAAALQTPPWTSPELRAWARGLERYRALFDLGPWDIDEDD